MLVLGFVLGVLVALAVVVLWQELGESDAPGPPPVVPPRAAIHEIERRTIHAMLAAELAAHQDTLARHRWEGRP
jgi:hypothetical protein